MYESWSGAGLNPVQRGTRSVSASPAVKRALIEFWSGFSSRMIHGKAQAYFISPFVKCPYLRHLPQSVPSCHRCSSRSSRRLTESSPHYRPPHRLLSGQTLQLLDLFQLSRRLQMRCPKCVGLTIRISVQEIRWTWSNRVACRRKPRTNKICGFTRSSDTANAAVNKFRYSLEVIRSLRVR
jgi:hypothetical protein